MADCIFCKVAAGEVRAKIVHETDDLVAFHDLNPQAPVHVLIIPKIEIPKVLNLKGSEHAVLLGEMIDAANKIAEETGIAKDGFRLVLNCGPDGGQEVYHLHMHILGGRKMTWPPG